MADGLRSLLGAQSIENPVMVGIHTGGVWIAERLHQLLDITSPLSSLDISFYRDDFTRIGMNPQVRPSDISFAVDDRHIVLVFPEHRRAGTGGTLRVTGIPRG